ncbi:MAG: pirin family protein [Xanthomonadales bacterium]|nr:pirin family protein [Xanthomonadales bacterium]
MNTRSTAMQQRNITNVMSSRPASDGAGVKINRLSGFGSRLNMDPFLMLDEIRSDNEDEYRAGFPPHPHRGFETVTYMRAGGFSHRDSMGNEGSINAGGAQWMTAGSGVIHSEMPLPGDSPMMHGFQFWLNLPAAEKMGPPSYRDIQGGDMVEFRQDDAQIRLVAGVMAGHEGVVTGKTTRALLADVSIPAGGKVELKYDDELSSQFYVYEGSVRVGETLVKIGQLASLGGGDALQLVAGEQAGLLLFGGLPINEPVAHHGPFVMNTAAEIEQAIRDYQRGTLVKHPARSL